jgi:hypothetical protein
MPRAKTKQELLDSTQKNFEILLNLLSSMDEEQLSTNPVFEEQTVKDILSHLYAWHLMFFDWYQDGNKTTKRQMPKEGFTWKQILS